MSNVYFRREVSYSTWKAGDHIVANIEDVNHTELWTNLGRPSRFGDVSRSVYRGLPYNIYFYPIITRVWDKQMVADGRKVSLYIKIPIDGGGSSGSYVASDLFGGWQNNKEHLKWWISDYPPVDLSKAGLTFERENITEDGVITETKFILKFSNEEYIKEGTKPDQTDIVNPLETEFAILKGWRGLAHYRNTNDTASYWFENQRIFVIGRVGSLSGELETPFTYNLQFKTLFAHPLNVPLPTNEFEETLRVLDSWTFWPKNAYFTIL